MTTRYQKLVRELESLRREAEKLREKEVAEVIAKMKRAIEVYGITAAELGFAIPPVAGREPVRSHRRVSGFCYADGRGNYWGGRGPRPRWLKALLEQGVPLEALRVDVPAYNGQSSINGRQAGSQVASRSASGEPRDGPKRPVKFRNEKGQTWSGRGPRPTWLRQALREGRTLSDFAVD